jgi:hypothetical protein
MSDFSRVLREFSNHRSVVLSTFSTLSSVASSSSPSPPAVFELYKTAFVQAAEEMKLASDAIEIIKKSLKRRRDPYAATVSSSLPDYGYDAYAAPGASVAPPVSASGTSKKTKNKTMSERDNIFNHEGIILREHTPVAALIDWHSNPPLWIQANIVSYRGGPRPKYTVLDHDVSSSEHGKYYHLDPQKIIPLPSLQEVPLHKRREFKAGERVLAVYPVDGVTTLYPATVSSDSSSLASGVGKKKRDKPRSEIYCLEFDDDDQIVREVHVEKICPLVDNNFSEE